MGTYCNQNLVAFVRCGYVKLGLCTAWLIRSFLGHPESQPFVKLYEDIAAELETRLDAWSDPDVPYERLLEVLVNRLFERDFDLRKHKVLTRTVVYYMYCNCDIAKEME